MPDIVLAFWPLFLLPAGLLGLVLASVLVELAPSVLAAAVEWCWDRALLVRRKWMGWPSSWPKTERHMPSLPPSTRTAPVYRTHGFHKGWTDQ